MEPTLLCVLLLLNTYINSGHSEDDALLKATLTVQPNPVFPGDTVTLQCDISDYTDWTYYWFRDNHHLPSQTSKAIDITIPITQTGQVGQYRCEGLRTDRPQISQPSDVVTISVTALPMASVKIVTPLGLLYPGETVTLQCDISDYTDWTYRWFRYNEELLTKTRKNNISLPDQAGQYRCVGTRKGRPQKSYYSSALPIIITALPTASVKIVTPQGLLYPGETVTLQCDISDYTDWTYYWFRDTHHLPSQTSKAIDITIPITLTGQAGQYRCEGLRTDRPQRSQTSDVVTISVTALPKTTLTVKPNPAYTGETVTLKCSVGSDSRWNYQRYKDWNYNVVSESVRHTISGDTHTISRAAEFDQGLYWCEGSRVSRPTSSQPSDPVTLTIKALPTASLKIVTPQGLLYPGETVTLQCDISDYTDWTYYWFRDTHHLPSQTSKAIDITIPITQTGQVGQYRCEGLRTDRPQRSQPSDVVTISVTALPKTTLTVMPNPAYTGETVTLKCSVGSDSRWNYQRYKDWNYNVVSESVRHTITGDTHTISRAAESDQGLYWCEGSRVSRPTSSQPSDSVTLTIKALPKTTLTVKPNPAYTGEKVTLKCSVGSDSRWNYQRYKDWNYNVVSQSVRHTITGDALTIRRAAESDQGLYWCEGNRVSRPTSSQPSDLVTLTIKALPKTTLTVKPNPAYTGETVTMKCSVGSDSRWNYQWYKDGNYNVVSQSVRHTITGDTLTISRAAESDQGLYWCEGSRVSRPTSSQPSDPVTLTIKALPKTTLTVKPNPAYTGETVTMKCSVGSDSRWNYQRYKDWNYNVVSQSVRHTITGDALTISRAAESDQGLYWCEGNRVSRPTSSQPSDLVTLTIKALPKTTLTVKPNPAYTGEKVTLKCSVGSDSRWNYQRYKDWNYNVVSQSVRHTITGDTLTISRAAESDQGLYWCEGNRVSRPTSSQPSDLVTLTIKDYQPSTTLTSDKENIFTGDSVTLSCTVESPGWKFYWYRHRPDSTPVTTTSGYSYTLSRVSVSDGGQYWCRAGRGDPVYYTLYSDPVQINVTERPVAVLTLQPNWTQIFSGETVTMRCDMQGGGDTDWNYRWYKNSELVIPFNTKTEYRISPVYRSNSGSYTCEGVKGNKFSKTSDAVQLTVSDQPQPVLSISPQWLNPGDSVTLSCEVDKTSTGWRFSCYRTVPYRAGLPSLSDKSYSLQPLSDNVTSEDSYTLIPAGPTPTGGYVCRAGRGDPVYYTLYSQPQFLWSGDLQPSVSLTVNPNRTQHFTSKSLSLICELKGNSTGWRLKRYTETAWRSECPSTWRSITESTCTITSLDTRSSGVFWCESGSGENSNAVNITVNDGDVILESPVHPVTEGDTLTLTCTFRHQGTNPKLKTDFYKDGTLIKNETTGEMTIPTVSKSDEGFYKCTSDEGESPESWVTVRVVAPGSSTSVLVGVVVGLLVAGVLLVILLVLLVRYQNSKGSCFNRIFWPPQPQRTNQDPQHEQESAQGQAPDTGYTHQQHGGTNIYDTINSSDNNDTDAAGASAAGPSHVTYAQIQLKKLDKKKKEKRNDPKDYPVYSEVKTGKATAAAGPVDVTYAEVDLQKKVKTKKKRETATPTEPESVYSLVKPYTVPAAGPVDVTYAEVDLQKKVKTKKKRERANPPEADSVYSRLKPRSCPGVGISLFNKAVGDSVELPSGLEREGIKSMEWKYKKMVIAEFDGNSSLPRSQFQGRLEMNDSKFSLIIRELTLQDSGEFLVSAASNKGGQIPTKTIHLQVHEPINKVEIQKEIKLLANQSCSVWMLCNVSVGSNLSYTWERGNETYRDDQQIHFSLSPADGDISVTCNASNLFSEKSASVTVKCSNDTTTPEYDTWMKWYRIYIVVPVGIAVLLILTVAVAVYYCRGSCNTADLTDDTRMKDTRTNSQVLSIYETVDDLAVPRLNKPQTLYDKITFGRQPEDPCSSFQEVL
ncbi:basement membrane-specific heparan sulfate proteoglycan core protein-like isoform X2 [Oncorhynchus masou masou]|uniref:basement membrane-specific heparan sulfate proteoglycan core protein-like isoform X2 n=1 Tax=Oncorhynchus masou masou TaxID=90313 RepID=UPI003182F4C5